MTIFKALGGFNNNRQVEEEVEDEDKIVPDVFAPDKLEEFETFSRALVCILLMVQHVWFAISTTSDAASAYEQV